nr:hypothetical protein [Mycobacterium gordonae]
MSTHVCADERKPVTPTAVAGEAMWIVTLDALVIVVLTLVLSCVTAGENELTTWPMPSGRICAPTGVRSCVVAERISAYMVGCHER